MTARARTLWSVSPHLQSSGAIFAGRGLGATYCCNCEVRHTSVANFGASLVALCIGTYRGIEHRDYKQLIKVGKECVTTSISLL